jgi:hypothetical protein
MTARPEPFFSWTARRVELREVESAVLVLDEVVPVGTGTARLIATRVDDVDYLICTPVCQGRRARRRPGPSSWAPPLWARSIWGWWRACRFRRVVNSDMRGLGTAGRLFGWSGSLSSIERDPNAQLRIAHR